MFIYEKCLEQSVSDMQETLIYFLLSLYLEIDNIVDILLDSNSGWTIIDHK